MNEYKLLRFMPYAQVKVYVDEFYTVSKSSQPFLNNVSLCKKRRIAPSHENIQNN